MVIDRIANTGGMFTKLKTIRIILSPRMSYTGDKLIASCMTSSYSGNLHMKRLKKLIDMF